MSLASPTDKSRGRFKFRSKGVREKSITLPPIRHRRSVDRQKELEKNRIYHKTPADWYNYHPDDPRDVTSSYQREGATSRWSVNDSGKHHQNDEPGTKIVYDRRMFMNHKTKRNQQRKGMVIGENPSLWRVSAVRRPELPGNLFVDNLRHQDVDWRQYKNVTWSDILDSHMKDINQHRSYAQTLPQKEHWLASIDSRVRYSKRTSNRDLPHVSPRLFNNKLAPSKAPVAPKYVSKDKQGNVIYIVGPGDMTSREIRPFVFPEISKRPPTPKKLDF